MFNILGLWFGVSQSVGRKAYAASGFGLMGFKYALDAGLIWLFTTRILPPHEFIIPSFTMRAKLLEGAPEWVGWAMILLTFPFLWIALSMSVRRAADAGISPWAGMIVLVPMVNLLWMVILCVLPPAADPDWKPRPEVPRTDKQTQSAILAIGASLLVGFVMMIASVWVLTSYGAALFLGTPLMMGATAAYLFNRPLPRTYLGSVAVGTGAVLCGCAALLLFAFEGVICVAMAMPLVLPLGAMGGLIGKAIANATYRPPRELVAAIVLLPLVTGLEVQLVRPRENIVCTVVEIDAPPEVVWEHVVHFPDLPPPEEWYFRAGIAAPMRARIEGTGVGATRYCEFTTGTFVEPITVWDQPERLAFDVTEQPHPMFELSPYRDLHPPHLDGALRSNHGEFLLIALPNGRTRLEGRTCYTVAMFPQWYWTPWSDAIIHRIHGRVLRHVKDLSEAVPEK
jgi:hypothetical protein